MSLRTRLTLAYLALIALSLSVLGLGVYSYLDRKLHRDFQNAVVSQGQQLALFMSTFEDTDSMKSSLNRTKQEPDTALFVETAQTGKRFTVLYATSGLQEARIPKAAHSGFAVTQDPVLGKVGLYSTAFTGHSVPIRSGKGNLPVRNEPPSPEFKGRVTIARALAGVDSSLRLLRNILVGGGLAVLTMAALLGLGLSAALLQPLARMRATAQRIGDERDFSRRMPVGNPRDELGRLSVSFNQMLTELEQAHADLQSTLEAQRRFVADASHELRTPMTAIRTNIEFLRRVPGARDEDRRGALGDVLAEMRGMESLVADLLALARLEAATHPAKRSFRLDHLLADIQRDAVRLAPAGVEVTLAPMPEVWVSGDRDDLRRAIWNLVDNALKYTRAGCVELALAGRDGIAELTVRDTGIGIAEPDQRHVFDRFWRAPGVRGTSGSGLGLAITKWVAQAHRGTVSLESTLGRGTTFTLRLPATSIQRPAAQPRPATAKPARLAHS